MSPRPDRGDGERGDQHPLLLCYPRRFRQRFGADFTSALRALAAEPRHARWRGRLRFYALVLTDVLRTAPAEWRDAMRSHSLDHDRRITPRHRMDTLLQDLRYALRSLRRSPGFVAVVVTSLALGIGANTLVFSVLDGIVLRPFAYPDADRLIAVGATFPKVSGDRRYIEVVSPHEYLDVRAGTPSLERVVAFDLGNRAIAGGDYPERVFTAFVWGDPLATLGMAPALGRSFRDEETTTPGGGVAVISHRLWQSRFGGDSGIVNRAVRVNGVPATIVGVLPPQALLLGTDLWLPMAVDPRAIPRQARQFAILGRVRGGASLDEVNRELSRVAEQTTTAWRAEHDVYDRWSLRAAPWAEALTNEDGVRTSGFVLQGAVLLVLLIACVNVAGLLVSRATVRQGEIAMRRALGAGRLRITRQLLTEGMMLAFGGALLGLVMALALMPPLTDALPDQIRNMGFAIRPNGRVLLATLGAALGVGLACAVVPAAQLGDGRASALFGRLASRTMTGGRRRLRALFLGMQVAMSVVLLVGATVLARSMSHLQRVEIGYDPQRILTFRLSVPREKYADSAIVPFVDAVAERIRAIPGVLGAGAATQYGVPNFMSAPIALTPEERGRDAGRRVDVTNVTPSLFPALGYRLQSGRWLSAHDTERAPAVAMLNETAARRYFPGRSPLGQRVLLGDTASGAEVEVVGVVGDARNRGLDAPVEPEAFLPARQSIVGWNNQYFLLVRTSGEPMQVLGAVRRAVQEADPDQPVYAISTVERQMGAAMVQRRAATTFLLVFAGIALVLAAVGIYGLVSYSVSERVREIGIRMALGADASRVRRLILRQTLVVVGAGVVVGLAASVAASGALRALVFGISPTDPLTLLGVAAVFALVAVVAALVPVRWATRIQPVTVLRE